MKRNENWDDKQNQSYGEYDNYINSDIYYQNPCERAHYPDKRKKRDKPGLRLLISLICILVAVITLYLILYIHIFSFKSELTSALSINSNTQIVGELKVDDTHTVYVVNDNGKLSASYIVTKGSGDEKSYKRLKECNSLNLDTYIKDMQGEKMEFSSKGDFHFALDFSGSEQYDQFIEYFDENDINDYKACPVNIEGINQIFIVWMWNK